MIQLPQDLQWTLASASARRLDILRQVGIEPQVIPADIQEINGGRDPLESALENARRKLEAVQAGVEKGILLAADTIVIVDGEVFGKPANRDEAKEMLQRLSGRQHEVDTAYSLLWIDRKEQLQDIERTHVVMRTLGSAEIDGYLATDEPWDKAGGYGIQGYAAAFIESVEGCYFNVVGLPIARILGHVNEWLQADGSRKRGA